VLAAAHAAPSVGFSQPWDVVLVRDRAVRERVHALAAAHRERYAASLPSVRAAALRRIRTEAILETPLNVVVTSDPTRGGRHTLGRFARPEMAERSAVSAVQNLWLAARAEGLGVGWVSFFDDDALAELRRMLGIPDHVEVVAYLCVGHVTAFPDEPELAGAGWARRRPLEWAVHDERWGRRALPGEEPMDLLDTTVGGIVAPDATARDAARDRLDRMTKPRGSLGRVEDLAAIAPADEQAMSAARDLQSRLTKPAGSLGVLEDLSVRLAGLSGVCPPPLPEPAAIAVFAGDHGVHAQGVTPWPQEVTAQMVANFVAGGAVINAFARQVGASLMVVDVGVAIPLHGGENLLDANIRRGTRDLSAEPAMTIDEARAALEVGISVAGALIDGGARCLLTGDMGIANTTPAAALIAAFTGADPAVVTGRGTGIDDETHARKIAVIAAALDRHAPDKAEPLATLAAVGGLEHAALAGFILGAAARRVPVIVDGVIAASAAVVAAAFAPDAVVAMVAGHRSVEPGATIALAHLGLSPLLDLGMRLGEGTGAALALPIVAGAVRVLHDVATFDSAGVSEK